MKKEVTFDTVQINIFGAHDIKAYMRNNEHLIDTESDVAELFGLEPFHYAGMLADFDTERLQAFNTYNWGAPIILAGVYSEEMDFALVNVHRGGDARGNYSAPYICEDYDDVHALLSQNTELYIALSDGTQYSLYCENGEAYFPFDTFDPYWIHFDEPLTDEQIAEIKEKMEVMK